MDVASINSKSRFAWIHTSTTLDASGPSLLGKISINVKRDRLYLLGMLPAKDSSGAIKQARIPLGLYDVPADHKVDEKRRAILQRQVRALRLRVLPPAAVACVVG